MILPGSIAGGFVAASLNLYCGDLARFWREILFARKGRFIAEGRPGRIGSPRDEGLGNVAVRSQPRHLHPVDLPTLCPPPRHSVGHLVFHMPLKKKIGLHDYPPRSPSRGRRQRLVERGPGGGSKADFKVGMKSGVTGKARSGPCAKLGNAIGSARATAEYDRDRLGRIERRPLGQGLAPPLPRQCEQFRMAAQCRRLGHLETMLLCRLDHGLGHIATGMAGRQQQQRRDDHPPAALRREHLHGIPNRWSDHLQKPELDRHGREGRGRLPGDRPGLLSAHRIGRSMPDNKYADRPWRALAYPPSFCRKRHTG